MQWILHRNTYNIKHRWLEEWVFWIKCDDYMLISLILNINLYIFKLNIQIVKKLIIKNSLWNLQFTKTIVDI